MIVSTAGKVRWLGRGSDVGNIGVAVLPLDARCHRLGRICVMLVRFRRPFTSVNGAN